MRPRPRRLIARCVALAVAGTLSAGTAEAVAQTVPLVPPASVAALPGTPVADPQIDAWPAIGIACWGAALPGCESGVAVRRAEVDPDPAVWRSHERPAA